MAGKLGQLAVAIKFVDFMLMARQHTHHRFTRSTQLGNGGT